MTAIGIGDPDAWIHIHCPHRPPLAKYEERTTLLPAAPQELEQLVAQTGNHWRKIINLYAKLMHELSATYAQWQHYRDNLLLQENSGTALVFSMPETTQLRLTLIMGQAYATQCGISETRFPDLRPWQNNFRYSLSHQLILTPYFDYRQLSNKALSELAGLIEAHFHHSTPTAP